MAKKTGSHVPKFGDWNNNNGNIAPYTAVFDKARKNRVKEGVKIMNPNDPEENPEAFAVVEKEKVKESGVMMIRFPNVVEEKNRRDSSESSSHVGRASLSLNRRRSNESELSAYSEKMSLECNTSSLILRQRRQQRLREKNEKKKSMDYSSSKRTTGAIEHHRRHSSITDIDMIPIPKFMDWDESNPKSSEDFTYKFNIVKKEKKTISEKFSAALSSEPNNVNSGREKPFSISKIICCFHPFPRGRACF